MGLKVVQSGAHSSTKVNKSGALARRRDTNPEMRGLQTNMQLRVMEREFLYNGSRIPDPDPKMEIEQVRELLTPSYPEIATATMTGPEDTGAFITRHGVTAQEAGPPTLGPAQPLTMAFVESLVCSIGGEARAEVLPEKVLAKTDRMLCWWTPPRQRQMFYNNAEGKCGALNGKVFLQPALVWRVSDGGLSLRALTTNKRPQADTKLAVAPYWNMSDDGSVCTGTMRRPSAPSIATIEAWERGFYESEFTHANVGRTTRHKEGFEALWSSIAGRRTRFPVDMLILLPQTLAQFVRNER
jgi:PRTRC genetic system protein B